MKEGFKMNELTAKQIASLNSINTDTETMKLGTKIEEIIETVNKNVTIGTPVNAVNASMALTVSGVIADGETITIDNSAVTGEDVYEFLADAAQTKTDPANIGVDITAYVTYATRVLTIDTQPVNGDTITIGSKTFIIVPNGTATGEGEIAIGANLAGAQANIVAAINGSDGHNTPHPQVRASVFAANACTLTALIGGTTANTIATTETLSATTNVFAGTTLTGGTNCTKANAKIAIVAAITGSDTQGVGAVNAAGDDITLTADVAGASGNNIVIGETLANGAFTNGATKLTGGVDGTVGELHETKIDDTYIYRCVAKNTVSDKNWRRISLGTAY
jgi:hypothetical protein